MGLGDIANQVSYYWHMEIPRQFNRHRRIYRDILLYSYLLDTDTRGKRKNSIELRELQRRVHVSEDEFNLCLGPLKKDGIFDAQGIASPEAFQEIKRLVEESYALDTPLLSEVSRLTPRQYLNIMFSPFDAGDAEDIRTVIAEMFRVALEVDIIRVEEDELLITARQATTPWGVWFQILPSVESLNDKDIAIRALATMRRHTRQEHLKGIEISYILVCPNVGGALVELIYEIDGLWIMVGTSTIKLLRELQRLAQTYSQDDLTNNFNYFFKFEQQEYTISVGDGLDRVKEHLPKI